MSTSTKTQSRSSAWLNSPSASSKNTSSAQQTPLLGFNLAEACFVVLDHKLERTLLHDEPFGFLNRAAHSNEFGRKAGFTFNHPPSECAHFISERAHLVSEFAYLLSEFVPLALGFCESLTNFLRILVSSRIV